METKIYKAISNVSPKLDILYFRFSESGIEVNDAIESLSNDDDNGGGLFDTIRTNEREILIQSFKVYFNNERIALTSDFHSYDSEPKYVVNLQELFKTEIAEENLQIKLGLSFRNIPKNNSSGMYQLTTITIQFKISKYFRNEPVFFTHGISPSAFKFTSIDEFNNKFNKKIKYIKDTIKKISELYKTYNYDTDLISLILGTNYGIVNPTIIFNNKKEPRKAYKQIQFNKVRFIYNKNKYLNKLFKSNDSDSDLYSSTIPILDSLITKCNDYKEFAMTRIDKRLENRSILLLKSSFVFSFNILSMNITITTIDKQTITLYEAEQLHLIIKILSLEDNEMLETLSSELKQCLLEII